MFCAQEQSRAKPGTCNGVRHCDYNKKLGDHFFLIWDLCLILAKQYLGDLTKGQLGRAAARTRFLILFIFKKNF